MTTTITLAGRPITIVELDFAQLKVLLPAINRVAVAFALQRIDESAMSDLGLVLSAATGIPVDQLDKLKIKAKELAPAFEAVVALAGLEPTKEGAEPGKSAGRKASTGKTSTPTSQLSSAGPGSRSTD